MSVLPNGVIPRSAPPMICDPTFISTLKPAFDQQFPNYTWFTDTKKLDFLL